MKEGDSKLALSQHQVMIGHKFLGQPMMNGVRVIDSDPRNLHRKVKEGIYIKLRGATVNRTGRYDEPDPHLPLLREEEETVGAGRD